MKYKIIMSLVFFFVPAVKPFLFGEDWPLNVSLAIVAVYWMGIFDGREDAALTKGE